jgi:hypothetical protein
MWGFLIGLYLAMLIYPFIEEWQQRRADKGRLAKMREYHATGRRWDVTPKATLEEMEAQIKTNKRLLSDIEAVISHKKAKQ